MRSRKEVLRGRVKGPLEIEFTEEPLTAYAGLELFGCFLRAEGWLGRLHLDGTVIRAGECVDGVDRGFHPHHPKDPSHYPLTAHLAQTGQILDVQNRSGRVNDSVGSVEMLEALILETRERLGSVPIEARLDGAFCQKAVLDAALDPEVEDDGSGRRLPQEDLGQADEVVSAGSVPA